METIMEVVETYLRKNKDLKVEYDNIDNPGKAAKIFSNVFGDNSQECLGVICLDTKNKPTHFSVIFKGTTNTIIISPKDILKVALLSNATSVIIAHNHPSSELQPSEHDLITTKNIAIACKNVDVKLLDHLIVNTKGDYYSIREHSEREFS